MIDWVWWYAVSYKRLAEFGVKSENWVKREFY
jgi:hypothetical protein